MAGAIAINPSRRPIDWPADGPIDLAVHDLPHPAATTEWWYVNAHVQTPGGRPFALFACFFRIVKGLDEHKRPQYAHSFTWALTDLHSRRYYPESRVDHDAPKMGLERVDRGEGTSDLRLRRAMREVLLKGNVPHPDQMFDGDVRVSLTALDLNFGGAAFRKNADGSYRLRVPATNERPGCDLTFTLSKAPVRHGNDGVVKGKDGGDMFYYFVPRCEVKGQVALEGAFHPVSGDGWYDHEFGGHDVSKRDERPATERPATELPRSGEAPLKHEEAAWNWLAVQLADGSELSAYTMTNPETGASMGERALIVEADGTRREYLELELTARNTWRSTRTFNDYPTQWSLRIPEAQVELEVEAAFPDQEFVTLISKPAFWEGRIEARGTRAGTPIAGAGYLERSGYPTLETLDDFFGAVGEEVRKSVADLMPRNMSYDKARDLIASEERESYMAGVDVKAFSQSMADPVRDITDRGGKSWRSYAALACCDVVGGDSREFVQWLAMPEFMHVGSLIVDDVQDQSTVRRGGPACHVVYGEPIAINAGTACYFLGQKLLHSERLSDKDKLRIYDLYFEALRAGHAGQALDLFGLKEAMDAAVINGDGAALEQRVLAIHRLKTAAPAASLARMGAVAGGGSNEQIDAVGNFFEAVGMAFQLMDDVLNLRGFRGKLKTRGEDLMRGMVTMPVAKAVQRLDDEARRDLWARIQAKPQEREEVEALIAVLEACGAVEACVTEASDLVESAWQRLDPLVKDSLPKLMLRAFGWYVLERQY